MNIAQSSPEECPYYLILSKDPGFSAIGQWASYLNQGLRKRFRCFKSDRTRQYVAPSEPTIRRVLQKTDAEQIDQMINEWL